PRFELARKPLLPSDNAAAELARHPNWPRWFFRRFLLVDDRWRRHLHNVDRALAPPDRQPLKKSPKRLFAMQVMRITNQHISEQQQEQSNVKPEHLNDDKPKIQSIDSCESPQHSSDHNIATLQALEDKHLREHQFEQHKYE